MIWLFLAACKQEAGPCEGGVARVEANALVLESGCADANLTPRVIGEGALTVTLEADGDAVVPVVEGQGTLRAVVLEGPLTLHDDAEPRLWKQGYQSWWWSGVTALSAVERDEDGLPVAGGDGDGSSATKETAFTSWWLGLLGTPDASLLLGALHATVTKVYVAFEADSATLVLGGRGEAIPVDGALRLDPIYGASGPEAFALHRQYAAEAAGRAGVSPRTDLPALGWGSWVRYYSAIDEAAVRENLEVAAAQGLELLLLDDGWERAWGDWEANEKFPSGMDGLAAAIRAEGLQPALWMAPFYVDTGALTEAHPDWWVRDESTGEPLTFSNFGPHAYHIVDVTHPEAAAWMQDQIRARVAEGWTWLKLDFLYAGAQEGLRQEPITGARAYQRGLQLLREAAGEDTFILACGAPMLPSLGWVDAYRTGADIAFEFDPDPRPEFLRWQARATAARSWQNGLWWWNDPDHLMVRDPFDADEARGAIAAQLVSGGPWLLGDGLAELDPTLLGTALDPALFSLSLGAVGEPQDPLSFVSGPDFGPLAELGLSNDTVPTTWRIGEATVLLNLDDHTLAVDGPGGRELFTGAEAGEGPRSIPPGGAEIWVP